MGNPFESYPRVFVVDDEISIAKTSSFQVYRRCEHFRNWVVRGQFYARGCLRFLQPKAHMTDRAGW
jgi:hypothetical protein